MKITLLMVASVDGKTTSWKEPHIHGWSSIDDQKHFDELKRDFHIIIMGRKTYESVKSGLKHGPAHLRIILTREPGYFVRETIPGQLEFTSEPPKTLIARLSKQGYDKALLVGGSKINSVFLKARLIHDLQLTLEPKLFGTGNSLFEPENFDIQLQLTSVEKLNQRGTLLLHYNVSYDY